jgi:hypothetical protein
MEKITKTNYRQPPTPKARSIFDSDSRGYNVLRNRVPEDLVGVIREKVEIWYAVNMDNIRITEVVFQKEQTNDQLRRQNGLEKIIGKTLYGKMFEIVEEELHNLYPDFEIYRPGKLLISLPGCGMQMMHMDFRENEENPEQIQLPIFIGIMESHIDMKTGGEPFGKNFTRVSYGVGDIIIMHGNQLHRGCSYEELNMRIYFYAIHKELKDNNRDGKDSFSVEGSQINTRNKNMK